MSPNFEVFKRSDRRDIGRGPAATVLVGGNISLNRAAYEALGQPDAVELLYDRDARIIGLRPVPREVPHAFPLQSRGSVRVVAGRAFAQHFRIDASVSTRRPAYVEDGVLCIDLRRPGQEVSRPAVGGEKAEGGDR